MKPSFCEHCYYKRREEKAYQHEKQGDSFFTNPSQSKKNQILMFWLLTITHSKDTFIDYIDRTLCLLPLSIQEVFIWSDGLALQFKNHFVIV